MPTGRMYHPDHHAHIVESEDRASATGVPPAPRATRAGRLRRAARRSGVVVIGAVLALGLLPAASQAVPEPTIAEVTDQVDALYVEMSAAVEVYNEATVRSEEIEGRLDTLQSNLERLQDDLDVAAEQAGQIAAAQYRSAGADPALTMLLSDDSIDFLGSMSQLNQIASRQAETVANLGVAKDRLAEQQTAVARETARLDDLSAVLETSMQDAEAKHAAAEALLERLTEEERARVAAEQAARAAAAAAAAAAAEEAAAEEAAAEEAAEQAAAEQAAAAEAESPPDEVGDDGGDAGGGDDDGGDAGGETAPPPPVDPGPVSGRAGIAVDFALAQVGDAYVWGASGPDAWDCSGLTSGAWGAAGVSLPHSSRVQFGMGTSVPSSQLQPGDLVFYYSPISHVGIYIGNGQLVQAANPSKPVNIAPVFSMPFAGARRVG